MLERSRFEQERGRAPAARAPDLEEAVDAFWAHHRRYRTPPRRSVARLAQLALSDDRELAATGTRVLFERVIEPLCDGFTLLGANTYRRTFAQVICVARRLRRCEPLHRALSLDGVRSERQLLRRPEPAPLSRLKRSRVRHVLVLSRLTLGADVAIALPVLQRMHALFPAARIAFVGTDSAGVVAHSVSNVEHVRVPYGRTAFLAERLNVWSELRRAVRDVCEHLEPADYVVVDPDSRLTQLGLLLPADAERYFHFPSRSYAADGSDALSILVGRWLDETFGACRAEPGLRISREAAEWSRVLRARCADSCPLVSVSFGVGGNQRKRGGQDFETDLLEWLVRKGFRVLLARGAGNLEVEESFRLGRRLAGRGVSVRHLPAGRSLDGLDGEAPQVVTWEADIERFFAAIACADAYVGYDSAGQHIAAALGVPTLSLFIESAGRRHALRWSPRGLGPVQVVRSPSPPDHAALLERAKDAFDTLSRDMPSLTRST